MGGVTSAVHWWEEWQLRVLVLTSLTVQFLLLTFSCFRRKALPWWCRFAMWLAYLAGDAMAIYALATLFNRHKHHDRDGGYGGRSSSLLEVLWAPALLIHLGGVDGITAYNIEDNELWTRHLLTAVSQVTVAIYVFCKSWPQGGDKRLLKAAVLLFVPGVLKCFHKPWALKRASFYSLVSSKQYDQGGETMSYPLEDYVKRAKDFVLKQDSVEDEGQGDDLPRVEITDVMTLVSNTFCKPWDGGHPRLPRAVETRRNIEMQIQHTGGVAYKLFVDLSPPYPHRLSMLEHFWGLKKHIAYLSLQRGLAITFGLLYTKSKTALFLPEDYMDSTTSSDSTKGCSLTWIQLSRVLLPWVSIGLFHMSQREAPQNNDIDVKITYVIFCCTAVLEYFSFGISYVNILFMGLGRDISLRGGPEWPEMVAQYSLIRYFARTKKRSTLMWIVNFFGCKDLLDKHWCMTSCFSSARITRSVLLYLKDGWKSKIQDVASYYRFNDHNSRWVNDRKFCCSQGQGLWSIKRPFDEYVILWHLATDFCFFSSSLKEVTCAFAEVSPEAHRNEREKMLGRKVRTTEMGGKCAHGTSLSVKSNRTRSCKCREELTACKAVLCRQMSNYMVYLLFVNPEMLMPGARQNLFTTAHEELVAIFKDEKPPLEERELTHKIRSKIESSQGSSVGPFIHGAWEIAQRLKCKDDKEMWEEIHDVWVEMLCYSASRCRGFLHAKALGKGGEFLSYVWLMLFHMGMETFTDRLQRTEEHPTPSWEWNNSNAPSPPLHPLAMSAPPSPHRFPTLHRLSRSAPASIHGFPRSGIAAEDMV